jgi:transcriptional regulator with XRE-family HTH domain
VSLPDDLHRDFGHALRDLRQAVGISQEALAHRAGLSANYISDLERGRKSPSLRTVARLAHVLGTIPSRILAQAES